MLNREDFILGFVSEARDSIDSAEECLLEMEKYKESQKDIPKDLIDTLFRDFHTLKGSSALLNLQSIVRITHEAETILELIRNTNQFHLIFDQIEDLLKTIDFLRVLFQEIESTKKDSQSDQVNSMKTRLHENLVKMKSGGSAKEEESTNPPSSFGLFDDEKKNTTSTGYRLFEDNEPSASYGLFEEPELGKDKIPSVDVEPIKLKESKDQPNENKIPSMLEPVQASTNSRKKEIKISTEKLDLLLDLVGELVIAESNVSHHPEIENLKLESFSSATRHLNKIVRDIQEVALSTRMIPIAGIFNRMNRLIRDLEKKTNKSINLQISGEETEIDKSVVDMISDPIIHILRNSIDHGIESPELRKENGKSERGLIKLHAMQSSSEVWIIILDDGAGLNKQKILNKAIQNKIISPNENNLSDKEIYDLIFFPGFSTAAEVSDISGRGVGMDIVKRNIETLGGRIEVQSQEGVGSKFILRIPLSLGIMEGTVIKTGSSYFTIQTIEVRELVKLNKADAIEIYKGQKVIEIRGSHIPMLSINDVLNLRNPIDYNNIEDPILIVLEYDGENLGLLADSILGNQSIVIKSLNEHLLDAKGVNGFTILGNGQISLILDTKSIFENFKKTKYNTERVMA